jgi:hypothetical protein
MYSRYCFLALLGGFVLHSKFVALGGRMTTLHRSDLSVIVLD